MPDPSRFRPAFLACWFLGPLIAVGVTPAAPPETSARPIVPGFERFSDSPGLDRVAGGRLLLGELNCVACHRGDEASFAPVARKQAPILDRVGSRIRVEYLRDYLTDPRSVRPGSTMPDLFAGRPKEEIDRDVDALVHLLASTGNVARLGPSRKAIGAGRTLYEQSGCAACHGSTEPNAPVLVTTWPIGDAGRKYSFAGLAGFLQDPISVRPSGRMPSMNLKPTEAQAVASFLLRDAQGGSPPSLAFQYYEGEWSELPDLENAKPVATGLADGFDLGVAKRRENYALRFEGTLELERAGDYTFHLASDDGSRLLIDGHRAIDNDGVHSNDSKSGQVLLTKGRHKLVVEYFQGGGQEELDLDYRGPGLSRRPVDPDLSPLVQASSIPAPIAAPFQVDPAKAAQGRDLFASIGCASCHQLRENSTAIEATSRAGPLAVLNAEAGCLASEPPAGVPHYHLSDRQRSSMASALKTEPSRPTEKESIARTLIAFNCTTCHARDGFGGVEEGRDPVFATTQKEMGDEGRVPPNLSGVGGKLTQEWLRKVLAGGAKDRPYMLTRMPNFGERNVGHLAGPLAAVDKVAPVEVPDLGVSDRKVKATGRHIVGSQAFNCGSCHQFKEYQAAGIQALDMTLMTRRLRRDWFHRYVVDPQAFRPGTRMPAAWPGGKSQLDSIYDGDTTRQIESIWRYLSDGPDAAVPYGLGRDPIPLVADKGPVIYRNFIKGAGARAIAVGYPEKANLAFDADELRLALIWQGAFIDASKHWTGRGEGFQGPLGDNILTLAAGPDLARLADAGAEWPRGKARDLGGRFRGYRTDRNGRPAFLYDVGEVRVEDFPEAVSGGDSPTIRRTFDLASDRPVVGFSLRAAVGTKVEPAGDGWYAIDGEWKVRISGGSPSVIRKSAGKAELIVPIKLDGIPSRVVEEFAW